MEAEEDEEDGVSGWRADILRKLNVVRDLPAEEMDVEFRKVMNEKRQFEMKEKRQKERKDEGKMPDCWNCEEVFSPDHQCFQPT